MNQSIRSILTSMNYLECEPGKWLKPVGYHLLAYNEKTGLLLNFFKSRIGEIEIWDTLKLELDERMLTRLKTFEAYSKYSIEPSSLAHFELLQPISIEPLQPISIEL